MTETPASVPPRHGGGGRRAVRYAYRVPLLLLHVLVPLPFILFCTLPPWRDWRVAGGEPFGHRMIRAWSNTLMRIFGMRMVRHGVPLPGAVLFAANHVSWIDITALHSQKMMGFVAKREIAGWPVVGWLATRGETIFHLRGSQESLGGVLEEMVKRLQAGRAVGVFPEGRTRGGHEVGPFHARIFLAAVEAGVPVQPIALRYGLGGSAQTVVAFQPGENFLQNFVRLLGEPARVGEVHFLEPVAPSEARRRIADLARDRIVAAMAG